MVCRRLELEIHTLLRSKASLKPFSLPCQPQATPIPLFAEAYAATGIDVATMTLLELITNASTNSATQAVQSKYPIAFNIEPIIAKLRPDTENPNPFALVEAVKGFEIEASELSVAEINASFFKKLQRRLKNANGLPLAELTMLIFQFLHRVGPHVGASVVGNSADEVYVAKLVVELGHYIGKDVLGLIIEACFLSQYFELLKGLVINGIIVDSKTRSGLLSHSTERRCHDLVILCIKHFPDFSSSDSLNILRLFLNPSRKDVSNLKTVRMCWEEEALSAVEKARGGNLKAKKAKMVKDAAILLMVAYDEFSASELCLHYLVSSSKVDESVLFNAISKLGVEEIKDLVCYLSKLLKKYERYPQAVQCSEASRQSKECGWVPSVKDAVWWLSLVLNEHFSTLVLHSEFHEELKSVQEVVGSLAAEAKLCCSLASLCEVLKSEEESST